MRQTWVAGVLTGLAVSAASFALVGGLMAQTSGGGSGRAATIDVVKVFNEYERQRDLSIEIKAVQDRLELENTQRRSKIDQMQAGLDAMDPTDPVYASKSKEVLQAQVDYKNWFDLKEAMITREVGIWTARVYREILKATEDVAKQNGYDIVLYRDEFQTPNLDPKEVREQIRQRKVLYASPASDVGQQVLDKLNADYRAQPKQPMIKVD